MRAPLLTLKTWPSLAVLPILLPNLAWKFDIAAPKENRPFVAYFGTINMKRRKNRPTRRGEVREGRGQRGSRRKSPVFSRFYRSQVFRKSWKYQVPGTSICKNRLRLPESGQSTFSLQRACISTSSAIGPWTNHVCSNHRSRCGKTPTTARHGRAHGRWWTQRRRFFRSYCQRRGTLI